MKVNAIMFLLLLSATMVGCTEAETKASEESLGCTYSDASNFNSSAIVDDGSCVYPDPPQETPGCTYSDALNYNQAASDDDGSCRYPVVDDPIPGCTYTEAHNYDINATEDDGTCVYDADGDGIIDEFEVKGCTDTNANNHNSSSTDDDGSCDYDEDNDGVYDWAEIDGCLDSNATNYKPTATDSNMSLCEYPYVMSLDDLQRFLENPEDAIFGQIENVTALIRFSDVTENSDEEELDSDSNANTTAIEITVGHDPINEIVYQSMVMRFLGDISMEQTTVQGHDGINYRIGSSSSGSWYYARDEVYQYRNPFVEEQDDDAGDTSEENEEESESLCDEFFEQDPYNIPDNWTLTHHDGVNTAEGTNESLGLDIRMEFIGNPPQMSILQISQINGMARCTAELLDPSEFNIEVDTSLPRTSMTMRIENEIQEDSGSTKTWSGELSEDHFEEVNLTEITLLVYAGQEESDDQGGSEGSLVTEMVLSEQTSTHTDQCYQWTLSWADNDNDGLTSSGDAYSVTRTEKVIDPCPEDDEYRNNEFQIVFYDDWANMPTGGVFTPGFGFIAAISAIMGSMLFTRRTG